MLTCPRAQAQVLHSLCDLIPSQTFWIIYIAQIYLSSPDISLHLRTLIALPTQLSPLGCFNRDLKLNMFKTELLISLPKPELPAVSLISVDGTSVLTVAQVKTLNSSATTLSHTSHIQLKLSLPKIFMATILSPVYSMLKVQWH